MQQYVESGLIVTLLKGDFHVHVTIFMSYVINCQEVNIDPAKLKNISKWPIRRKNKQLESLLVFANY